MGLGSVWSQGLPPQPSPTKSCSAPVQSWRHVHNTQWNLLPPCKQRLGQRCVLLCCWTLATFSHSEFTISSLTREITPPSSFWIRPPGSLWESVSLPSTLSWLWQPHLGKQCWYLQDSFPNSRFLFGSWGPHSVCFFPFFWLLLWIDSRNLHFHWWHNKALVESTVNWDSEALGLSRLCHYHCKFRWALNFPGLQFLLP